MYGTNGEGSTPSAGRALFWAGIVSGTLGIFGGVGALVIVSGKAPSTKATAGLVATASSEPASSSSSSSSAAHNAPNVRDEERTDHDKADTHVPSTGGTPALAVTPSNTAVVNAPTTRPGTSIVPPAASSAAMTQPDLLPARVVPGVIDALSAGRFGVVVRNTGRTMAIGPFSVRVTVDGRDVYTTSYPGNVDVNAEATVLIPRFRSPSPGPHKFDICVDTGGEVREASESNNCAVTTIVVR